MKNESTDGGYTLGLDIGIASVGAALLSDSRILALYVRAFDKAETSDKGESLNKARRDARSTRRRLRRRSHRLTRLRRLFKRTGLLESDEASGFIGLDTSPWCLRAEGLDRMLDQQEWAAALYHVVKHRGFQSNRKSEVREDEKAGAMLSGVNVNQQRMKDDGWRTIGEMFANDERYREAKRNKGGDYSHTVSRRDLHGELQHLFAKQRDFGNGFASPEFEEQVVDLLLARRPTLSGDNLRKMIGRCTFEPSEFRAPKACYFTERFLWLTKLNNLRVSLDGRQRELTPAERDQLIDQPFLKTKLSYKQVRALLNLPDRARFNISYRRKAGDDELKAERASLFEAKAYHALRGEYRRAGLDDLWKRDAIDEARLNLLGEALTVFKDDDEARHWLRERGVEPEVVEAVLNLSFSSFIRLSLRAVQNILPHMQRGMRFDEAVVAAGYTSHSSFAESERTKCLPPIPREEFTNPVVYRALSQARKLVNAIIREHGSPAAVHIELARDLSKPWDERRKIEKDQQAFQENKKKAVDEFVERFGTEPSRDWLTKYRLYKEQDGKCAYSLKALDLNRLMEDGYAEIDHALPYSRSFDNSMNNKVLVHTVENRNKGNLTPYEYLNGESQDEQWRRFEVAVLSNPKYRKPKRERLLRKDFGAEAAEGFRERNLSDTRYICRSFKNLVETHLQLAGERSGQRCVVVSGQLTGFLRARWGLLKVRAQGDKHHALDAAVVAACSPSMVKRLSDYSRREELEQARGNYCDPETGEIIDIAALRQLEARFPVPWPHFRHELEAKLSTNPVVGLAALVDYPQELVEQAQAIRVSRAPQRRGTGQAHEATIRSAKWLDQQFSTVKTPLTKLKIKDLPNIRGAEDPRNAELMRVLRERLEAYGDKPDKAFKEPVYKPSKPGKQAPLVRSVKLARVQKSGVPVRKGIADNGDMLCLDVFTDGKKFYSVPIYVADLPRVELPNLAAVANKPEAEWLEMGEQRQFLCRLFPNDWVKVSFKNKPSVEGYYAGFDRSTAAISIWAHDRNQDEGKNGLYRGIGIKTALKVEKFHVDALGRLYAASLEVRSHPRALKARRD